METRAGSKENQRIPLTRERVLLAAIARADESGIDSLTMRKLANSLGVEAMSLYYHVANKDDMLDGMLDIIVSEIDLPVRDVDWKTAMRHRAISAHDVFSRHAWAAPLMESRTNPGSATLTYYDSVLGCLLEAGFSIALAASAFSVLDAYVYGFGLQELSLPFDNEEEVVGVAEELLEGFPVDEYPALYKMIVDYALQPGYDYGAEFAIGLDLILDGLERLHEADQP